MAGQNHHYHHHNHHNHQQNNVVTSTSSQTNSNNHQKKLSTRTSSNGHNGDVIKRTRTQNGYELSQDLLDKQIELLERKYGGIRARKAALTIQRAFRRYIMDRRFAAITANAKADKRTSYSYASRIPSSQSLDIHHHELDSSNGLLMKGTPIRSMSLRGRGIDSTPTTPLKSPGIKSSTPQHPYVNIMHQQQQQQYYFNTPPSQYHHHQQLQYQNQSLMDSSVSSTSMNSSWHNSSAIQQQPQPSPLIHYTAAQIYMRPRSSLNNSNPNLSGQLQQPCSPNSFSKRPPPEVPKRTSSVISTGSGGSGSGCGMKNGGRSNGLSKSGKINDQLIIVSLI